MPRTGTPAQPTATRGTRETPAAGQRDVELLVAAVRLYCDIRDRHKTYLAPTIEAFADLVVLSVGQRLAECSGHIPAMIRMVDAVRDRDEGGERHAEHISQVWTAIDGWPAQHRRLFERRRW